MRKCVMKVADLGCDSGFLCEFDMFEARIAMEGQTRAHFEVRTDFSGHFNAISPQSGFSPAHASQKSNIGCVC